MNSTIFRLFFLLTFVLWIGCQRTEPSLIERLPYSDAELRAILAHTPSDNIDATIQRVSRLLDQIYAERMPEYLPNWIAFHALIMYGEQAYPNWRDGIYTNENLELIFPIILVSETQELGSFTLRDGLPYPLWQGPYYFMQEHHPDQFLLYFAMAGGTLDAPLTIDGAEFTFHDLLERSLLDATTLNELAFTVAAYAMLLPPGKRWQNKFGETMSLAILLEKLLATPERTCLGTHRIGALAKVYARKELLADRDIARLWTELERQVLEALVQVKQSQRPDGSFEPPTRVPGSDILEDIYYTGHCLEWITFLGEDYCRDDWVVHAIDFLAGGVEATYRQTYRNLGAVRTPTAHFDFGGLSHAVSALKRWHDHVE